MLTIHLLPDSARSAAQTLNNSASTLAAHLQELNSAARRLDPAWQGGGKDAFSSEMDSLLRLLNSRQEELALLVARLEGEIAEWEETDQRGASGWRTAVSGSGAWLGISSLPLAAGSGSAGSVFTLFPGLLSGLPPLMLADLPWSNLLPAWLRNWLTRLFPPAPVISPIPENQPTVQPGELHRIVTEKLGQQTPPADQPASPSAQVAAPVTPKYEIYYDMPARSQGNLYGSAACAPTSASMVMDYFHTKDSANASVTTEDLIKSLDPGDGTPGSGISLSDMTDELNDLGYKNISQKVGAGITDLKTALKDGPVIVTAGVGIVGPGTVSSSVPRAITGPGGTMHALVVKGLTEGGSVVVNDPWTGSELTFDSDTFGKMWSNGSDGMYVIRP